MSHEVARTPGAGAKIAIGTGVFTATALKTSAALSNTFSRSHAHRWLRGNIPRLISGATSFIELCTGELEKAVAGLPSTEAEKLQTRFVESRTAILSLFCEATLYQTISVHMESYPQLGAVGALEYHLRMALAPTFKAVDTLSAYAPVLHFRRQLTRNATKALKLDVTPRPGLNVHRSIRRKTFLVLCALPVLFLVAVLCLSMYAAGVSGGLKAVSHAVSGGFAAMFHHK